MSKPTKWAQFTKRTNDPKLAWLERRLDRAGIRHRRNGESWHAPILEVPEFQLPRAWRILDPIDDIPDDDPRFVDGTLVQLLWREKDGTNPYL